MALCGRVGRAVGVGRCLGPIDDQMGEEGLSGGEAGVGDWGLGRRVEGGKRGGRQRVRRGDGGCE